MIESTGGDGSVCGLCGTWVPIGFVHVCPQVNQTFYANPTDLQQVIKLLEEISRKLSILNSNVDTIRLRR